MTREQHATSSSPGRAGARSGLGITACGAGLAGLLLSWEIPILGLLLGGLGVLLGAVGRRRSRRGDGPTTAGILLGALAIVASTAFTVVAYNALT